MKRLVTTLLFAGLVGWAGMPRSADAGIFSRRFGCKTSGAPTVVVTPSDSATADAGRRYSYEPAESNTVRRSSSNVPSRVPNYLYPKTDPRRYLNY